VIIGALMIGAGLALASSDGRGAFYIGHGLFIGLLGNACINAPLYVYVSRWFDRRRGSAMALISSGQYLAGVIWPTPFEHLIAALGWRGTMLIYAVFEIAVILPVALIMFGPAPEPSSAGALPGSARSGWVLGLRPRVVQGLLCLAGFLCCVPMAMPQGHLVALCSDLGISQTHGAAMLSLLLGCAFLGRQFWGLVTDRIGGLRTVLAGSLCQVAAMIGFLLTQDEAVCRGGDIRPRFRRHHSGLCCRDPRIVPGGGGGMAGADAADVQRFRHGGRRLARRTDLRLRRLLRRRLRRRDRLHSPISS
jgi:MFS family permease